MQHHNSTKIKAYYQRLQAAPQYNKILVWGKLISITGAAQVFVQVVSFISGILIIRFLAVEEYAFYILANTMLGTMSLLADGGITASMMSQGGEVWNDKKKLGVILATGMDLRKKFAIWSLVIFLPVLAYLLLQNGASGIWVLLILLTLIPAFYAELSDALLDIVPKLHQRVYEIQKIQGVVAVGRLFLTVSFIAFFPFTFIALLSTGIPRIYGNQRLKNLGLPFLEKQKPCSEVRKKILKTVTRIMPGAIYYCLSGQITIWILSFFGNTTGLAQLGALTKFAIALSLVNSMVSLLIIPRFARQRKNRRNLRYLYNLILLGIFIFLTIASLFTYFFPSALLWVLGTNYAGLETELFYTILGSSFALLSGIATLLNMSRNWIVNPLFSISVGVLSIVIGVMLFDVSQLQGILLFNMFLAIVQFVINFFYGLFRIQNIPSTYPI